MVALILGTDTQMHLEELAAFRLRLGASNFDTMASSSDRNPWHVSQVNQVELNRNVSMLCQTLDFEIWDYSHDCLITISCIILLGPRVLKDFHV